MAVPNPIPARMRGLNRAEITRQMEESDEITAVVHALEQQYDTFLEGRQQRNLLATTSGQSVLSVALQLSGEPS